MRYGTAEDEGRSQWLFELSFPSFGLIIVGELIRIYKLGDYSGIRARPKLPWDHKWGLDSKRQCLMDAVVACAGPGLVDASAWSMMS